MTINQEQVERFHQQVEQEWKDPRVAESYRRWDRDESEWGRAACDRIIERANLSPGLRVLDLGSGHGEPGLAIAERVGSGGCVTLTDLNADLLAIASRRAEAAGLRNVDTRVADAHQLPFADGSFDRVTCRFAAMYFADHLAAFREAARVLRPGGSSTWLVWAGFDQPIFRDVVGPLFAYVTPPEDEPGAPSPFKFAEPGSLHRALEEAGFVRIQEQHETLPTTFHGTPERWWEWFVDMAVPLQSLIGSLTPDDKRKALGEVHTALNAFVRNGSVNVPIDVIVATAERA